MKNNQQLTAILLPTEDASPIYINGLTDKLFVKNESWLAVSEPNRLYQHLNLCSNQPIKEGDWYYCPKRNLRFLNNTDRPVLSEWKKIEFSSDPKLISDGVPAIDGNTKARIKCSLCGDVHISCGGSMCSKCMGKPIEVNFLSEFCSRYNQKDNQKVVLDQDAIQKPLQKYIDEKKNQDECSGFIDGFRACEALQNAVGFSLEDKWRDIAIMFYALCKNTYGKEFDEWVEAREFKKLESISKPTKSQSKGDIVIECEIECKSCGSDMTYHKMSCKGERIPQIKLTNGQPILTFK